MRAALIHHHLLRISRRFSDAARVVLIGGVLVLALGGVAHARGLRLGFFDGSYVGDPATRSVAFARTTAVGGSIVRLAATWSGIAPTKPARPADPNDPAYRWGNLDGAVRDAVAAGLTPLVAANAAPAWAEGAHRPQSAGVGTWR